MSTVKKSRYKQIGGRQWIEVRVHSPHQLFDARDPAPFRERDLDDDFVEYILASAREVSSREPLKIAIHVEETEKDLSRAAIKEAIHEFFNYKIEMQRSELRTFLKRAQMILVLGLATLFLLLTIAQRIPISPTPNNWNILREGLVIFGWVSIWKPIELILFDWYPLLEELRFFHRLLEAEIEIRFGAV